MPPDALVRSAQMLATFHNALRNNRFVLAAVIVA